MSSDPERLRRCRSTNPFDPTMQCQGEASDVTTHIEDHWNGSGREIARWSHLGMPIANPERVRAELQDFARSVDLPHPPASERQVGGDHYRRFKIQPWDVIDEYDLSFYAGNCLKYLLRAGRKGSRLEDLKKARHYLDKMIELEEGGE